MLWFRANGFYQNNEKGEKQLVLTVKIAFIHLSDPCFRFLGEPALAPFQGGWRAANRGGSEEKKRRRVEPAKERFSPSALRTLPALGHFSFGLVCDFVWLRLA